MKILLNSLFLLVILFQGQPSEAQSTIKFRIKNAGFTVSGFFSGFNLDVKYDKNQIANSKFNGTVKVESINSGNSSRDNHLKKSDFFDVAKYPTMKFESTSISTAGSGKITVTGNLTIKNITKKVSFETTVGSKSGKTTFSSSLLINRIDFGVGESSWTLANELYIDLYVEK